MKLNARAAKAPSLTLRVNGAAVALALSFMGTAALSAPAPSSSPDDPGYFETRPVDLNGSSAACARKVSDPIRITLLPPLSGVVESQTDHQPNSFAMVQYALNRIQFLDCSGPSLHAVIALNPHALDDARRLDAERKAGHVRGPLHGVPILIKDNIESDDGTATTGGSLALKDNLTRRDAPLVARLKAAGAVILGKTNLSEWANMRSSHSISGWSAVGGLVRNPYALDRSACGSSAGSAAAVAAGLGAAAIGTETDGSITCPASMNGIVGIKPTVGLVSRTYVVPISHNQDTPGPMARSVEDAAAVLSVIAGSDPNDPATAEADAHKTDYAAALSKDALKGARIGVLRPGFATERGVGPVYEAAVARLRTAGAILIEVDLPLTPKLSAQEHMVLITDLKTDLNAYLAATPLSVQARSLAELIAFNTAPRETVLFGQDTFEQAQATDGPDDPAYKTALEISRSTARSALDTGLNAQHLDALVSPTTGPAWRIDTVDGDHFPGSFSTLPAVAGYPHLTVPMGQVSGMPVGLSFVGPAWSEARLLALGYAFQETGPGFTPPTFRASVEDSQALQEAFNP
jgi:amidase